MDDETERLIRRLRDIQGLGKLVGGSRSFRDAIAVLPAAAASDAAVLITGETGTGKELVAHAIHYLSGRAPFPFVAVNCSALTDTLLENELFGHARGAFTGADQPRAGPVAHAHRGTLFLDEIDCLTPRAQVALLRLLQDKLFRPVGSSEVRRADVRFVAATNAPSSSWSSTAGSALTSTTVCACSPTTSTTRRPRASSGSPPRWRGWSGRRPSSASRRPSRPRPSWSDAGWRWCPRCRSHGRVASG
jgi:hypothetical protein